mgnify:CR=1 FL=1
MKFSTKKFFGQKIILGIAQERKEAKYEKEQAEQYEKLLAEHAEAKTQHALFQLYIHDKGKI